MERVREQRPEWSQMQTEEKQRHPEDSMKPVKIHHVVVPEEPGAAGRSL
jgi:hypothetical protein